jgi:hypothetical protein
MSSLVKRFREAIRKGLSGAATATPKTSSTMARRRRRSGPPQPPATAPVPPPAPVVVAPTDTPRPDGARREGESTRDYLRRTFSGLHEIGISADEHYRRASERREAQRFAQAEVSRNDISRFIEYAMTLLPPGYSLNRNMMNRTVEICQNDGPSGTRRMYSIGYEVIEDSTVDVAAIVRSAILQMERNRNG